MRRLIEKLEEEVNWSAGRLKNEVIKWMQRSDKESFSDYEELAEAAAIEFGHEEWLDMKNHWVWKQAKGIFSNHPDFVSSGDE